MKKIIRASLFIAFIFVLYSCGPRGHRGSQEGNITKIKLNRYSQLYSLYFIEGDSTYILELYDPTVSDVLDTAIYKLSKQVRTKFGNEIKIPITSIAVTSATHLGMINELGEVPSIVGYSSSQYIYNNELIQRIKSGKVKLIGFESSLNQEVLLGLQPQLIMLNGGNQSNKDEVEKILGLGLLIIENNEWMEPNPLARAEWIKVFGALYDRYDVADSIFCYVEKEYQRIKSNVDSYTTTNVIINAPYKGNWWMPGGKSYLAKLIQDVGGNYGIDEHNESSGGIMVSFEKAYQIGSVADCWINPGSVNSIEELISVDGRLAGFNPIQKGKVFNSTKRINGIFGNDYFEKGVVRPDLILKDIGIIVHGDSAQYKDMFFYKKLE